MKPQRTEISGQNSKKKKKKNICLWAFLHFEIVSNTGQEWWQVDGRQCSLSSEVLLRQLNVRFLEKDADQTINKGYVNQLSITVSNTHDKLKRRNVYFGSQF
jgi:hypothetical protein